MVGLVPAGSAEIVDGRRFCRCGASLLLAAAAWAHAALGEELALNGDFSQGAGEHPSFWAPLSVTGTANYTWVEDGVAGSRCVKIECDDDLSKASWALTTLRVKAGATIEIGGKIRFRDLVTHDGLGFRAVVHYYGPQGYLAWTPSNGILNDRADWQSFQHRVKVPANATHARFSFRLARTKGTLWLDDVTIRVTEPGTDEADFALPQPAGTPLLTVGVLADIIETPVYQLADHLARHRVAIAWLQGQDLAARILDTKLVKLDVLLLMDHTSGGGDSVYSEALADSIVRYVMSGGGLVVTGLDGLPPRLLDLLPVARPETPAKQIGSPAVPRSAPGSPSWVRRLPGAWPHLRDVFGVALKSEASLLLEVGRGPSPAPFLAAWEPSKGRTVFLNARLTSASRAFWQWRSSPAFLAQLLAWAAHKDPAAVLEDAPVPGLREPLRYLSFGSSYFGYVGPIPEHEVVDGQLIDATVDVRALQRKATGWERSGSVQPRVVTANGAVEISFGADLRLRVGVDGRLDVGLRDGLRVTSPTGGVFPRVGVVQGVAADRLVDLDTGASEPQMSYSKSSPLADGAALVEAVGDGPEAVVQVQLRRGGKVVGRATWRVGQQDVLLHGRIVPGLRLRLLLDVPGQRIGDVYLPVALALTTPITPYRLAAYSRPRGPFVKTLRAAADCPKHNVWYFGSGGQAFHFASTASGSFISFFGRPELVRAEIRPGLAAGTIVFDHGVKVGAVRSAELSISDWHMLFPRAEVGPNEWLDTSWFIEREYCDQAGIQPQLPRPTMQARYDRVVDTLKAAGLTPAEPFDCRAQADLLAPICREDGFRIVDVGSVINPEVSPDALERHGGEEAIRHLTKTLGAVGADAYSYWRITFWAPFLPIVKGHPDWPVKGRDGKPMIAQGLTNLSMRSGYRSFAEETLKHYMDLGIKGVWFDSLSPAVGVTDYSRPSPRPQMVDVHEHFATMYRAGLRYFVEGMSPLGLDSHWFRYGKYGDSYAGNDYMLFGSTLFATHWDTVLFLDYFRAASFLGLPMVDFDVVIHRENPLTHWIRAVNRKYNDARQAVGEFLDLDVEDFGTVWRGSDGLAVFAHRPVRLRLAGGTAGTAIRRAGAADRSWREASSAPIELGREDVLLIREE